MRWIVEVYYLNEYSSIIMKMLKAILVHTNFEKILFSQVFAILTICQVLVV